jgi:diguanylate cyclase (GGDEF)-like protein
MSEAPRISQPARDPDDAFRDSRTKALISVNLNTFWSSAVILMSFSMWDAFVDPAHWRAAFTTRIIGTLIVIATGVFQKLPGRSHWMPRLAKVRLVIAVVTSLGAAAALHDGYGFGVAGLAVIILTGPYIAIDSRDLAVTNLAIVAALVPVMFAESLSRFDMIGTIVFVLLAIAVSTLLGRILETSNRRAFALDVELQRDARTDALTGLSNRRAIQERGRVELKRARRSGAPVSLLLCDLDHFKHINDRHGHEAGDLALIKVAAVLGDALRESDALGRWGGEEFIAVLPATDAAGAADVAERVRHAIEHTTFDGLGEGTTISVGVTTMAAIEEPISAWDLLVKTADQHLYRAKAEGRNRIVSGSQPSPTA